MRRLIRLSLLSFALVQGAGDAGSGHGSGTGLRRQRRPAAHAGQHLPRRGGRRRPQLAGPHLRLHADRPSLRHARRQPHVLSRRLAAVRVRRRRQVRARAGAGRLRLQHRVRPARRSAGQRLDHRSVGQPGGEVRRPGPRRAGARPEAGGHRGASRGAAGRRRARRQRQPAARRSGRRSARASARIGHPGLHLQPADRRGLGPRRQHLHRRRRGHHQPHRQVRQGRHASSGSGARPGRSRASSTA